MSVTDRSPRRLIENSRRRSVSKRNTKPVNVRRATKSKKPELPPVMARVSTYGAVTNLPKIKRKTNRRFDVLVNSKGAEMRLPALPHINLDWRLLSFLLVLTIGFALYQVMTLPLFRVQEIQIHGLEHMSGAEIGETLHLTGKPVYALNPEEIKNELLKNYSEFSDAEVTVSVPNNVEVFVKERVPVLIWRMAGKSNLVDADGMPFILRENYPIIDLPLIHAEEFVVPKKEINPPEEEKNLPKKKTGKLSAESEGETKPEPLVSPKMVSAVIELNELAPFGVTLMYTNEHGLGWQEQDGWFVYFGEAEEISMKYSVYEALKEYLQKENLTPSFISVEHVHIPFYRLTDE